jgi:hypothetical protein
MGGEVIRPLILIDPIVWDSVEQHQSAPQVIP